MILRVRAGSLRRGLLRVAPVSDSPAIRPRTSSATATVAAHSSSTRQISCPLAIGSPGSDRQAAHDAVAGRGDLVLHLHRLDDADDLAGGDAVTLGDVDLEHRPLHRAGHGARAGAAQPRAPVASPPRRAPPTAGSVVTRLTSNERPSTSTATSRDLVRVPSDRPRTFVVR